MFQIHRVGLKIGNRLCFATVLSASAFGQSGQGKLALFRTIGPTGGTPRAECRNDGPSRPSADWLCLCNGPPPIGFV
jgi:hypothetical protein